MHRYYPEVTTPEWVIEPDQTTTRSELGETFGGNQQAGIAHSKTTLNVMIYSDRDETESPGYAYDGWDDAGEVFHYTGEGKRGDQKLTNGNKAILNHIADDRALRVFVADGNVPGTQTRVQRYIGEFYLDTDAPYSIRQAPQLGSRDLRQVFVFNLRPKANHVHRISDHNSRSGVGKAVEVEINEVPIEVLSSRITEYQRVGSATARKREAELVERFETYLIERSHRVCRYRISIPGSTGDLYTDIADATDSVVFEAKGVASRVSVRLALGQILDYGRYVAGSRLALLLPGPPPVDMLPLLESCGVACVIEDGIGVFRDLTTLERCP